MMVCCPSSDENDGNVGLSEVPASNSPIGDDAVARLSALCARQIKEAMDDERAQIADLSQHLLSAHKIASNTREQYDHAAMLKQMSLAATKLQFADRLSQRLLNIAGNLTRLNETLMAADGKVTPEDWANLLQEVRLSFSMEAERQLFDSIVSGAAESADVDDTQAGTDVPELF